MSSVPKSIPIRRMASVKYLAALWQALVAAVDAYLDGAALPVDSAVTAYQQRKELAALISKLEKRSAALKAVMEARFRENQRNLTEGKYILARTEVCIEPTEVPKPYSYFKYELRLVG